MLFRSQSYAIASIPNYYAEQLPDKVQKESLLFTDREIYRPGQRIQWKVLGYEAAREQGQFKNASGQSITVSLHDANGRMIEQITDPKLKELVATLQKRLAESLKQTGGDPRRAGESIPGYANAL